MRNIIEMKFNHTISNPPFGRLYLKIIREIFKYSDDHVVLSPIRWLQDPSGSYKKGSDFNKFEDIREKIESIDIIDKVRATELFNAAFRYDLGIYHITKNGGLDCDNYWKLNANPAVMKIIKKIGIPVYAEKTMPSIHSMYGKNSEWPFWIKCPRTQGHPGKKDEFDLIAPDIKWSLNVEDKEGKQVYFKTEEEARNFFETLKSPLYKFIKKVGFYSTANSYTGMPWLGDYSHPWTDTDLYEYFGLNEEEIEEIENAI